MRRGRGQDVLPLAVIFTAIAIVAAAVNDALTVTYLDAPSRVKVVIAVSIALGLMATVLSSIAAHKSRRGRR